MTKKGQYVKGEFQTLEQDVTKKPPTMEGYNPNQDIDSIPQQFQQPQQAPQFLDLNNPQNYARNPNQPFSQQGYQQQLNQRGVPPVQGYPQQGGYQQPYQQSPLVGGHLQPAQQQPNWSDASMNMQKLESITDAVEAISKISDKDGDSVKSYAIGVAIKKFREAATMMQEIEYWIPRGKENYVPKLKQISKPISDAINKFTDSVEKLR